ncbi:putative ATP-dependent RNA helicase YTHDC2 [Trichoplax sp. H2]|nr:putative ATP-dependent RNA helicase YTHDC2 [Trichoplax sp. H2]|eukprot:RDD43785.1 putative ATP-dependent RNA helicase YTHDC2 [Trichoplax sp. H2]
MAYRKRKYQTPNISQELQDRISAVINNFIADHTVQELEFPPSLLKEERAFIHQFCKPLGLISKSQGWGSERFLTVRRSGNLNDDAKITTLTLNGASKKGLTDLISQFPHGLDQYHGSQPEEAIKSTVYSGQGHKLIFSSPCIPLHHYSTQQSLRHQLPIVHQRSQILAAIQSNKVIIVMGETGCGKTTQIPQYILEDAQATGKPCRIICTQPRRLSAIGVAERVAYERGEPIGSTIGYQIRLESKISPDTCLLYCTTGILLRYLTLGAPFLDCITHIVVDEVHERDKLCDFLLITLRKLIEQESNIKLILSSATLNSKLFSQYFFNCPILKVDGHTYPVEELYLEDILIRTKYISKLIPKNIKQDTSSSLVQDKELNDNQAVKDKKKLVENDDGNINANQAMDNYLENAWIKNDDNSFRGIIEMIENGHIHVDYQHSETSASSLMIAAGHGKLATIESLLQLSANVNLKSINGWTARDWALKWNRPEAVEKLDQFSMEKPSVMDVNYNRNSLLKLCTDSIQGEKIDYDLITHIISYICKEDNKGAILVFLPGYEDIVNVKDRILQRKFSKHSRLKIRIFILHSLVEITRQREIFKSCPHDVKKIILSTNIAETSITIDDVVDVIDSGRIKMKNFDALSSASSLTSAWISKANAKQRAGRAGRCQPGRCYHIYSKSKYNSLSDYLRAEILRIPLQELALQVKLLNTNVSIAEFLNDAIEPPSFIAVNNAVECLKAIGALDENENLTELGKFVAEFPVEPRFAKAILYAITLRCLEPILIIVSTLSYRDPFILPDESSDFIKIDYFKRTICNNIQSDHYLIVQVFEAWQKSKANGFGQSFCKKNYLSKDTLEMIRKIKSQLVDLLKHLKIFKTYSSGKYDYHNKNSGSWTFVNAALVAGLYPNIAKIDPSNCWLTAGYKQGRSIGNNRFYHRLKKIKIHRSSMLFGLLSAKSATSKTHEMKANSNWFIYNDLLRNYTSTAAVGLTVTSAIVTYLFSGSPYPKKEEDYSAALNNIQKDLDVNGGKVLEEQRSQNQDIKEYKPNVTENMMDSENEAENIDVMEKIEIENSWISFTVAREEKNLLLAIKRMLLQAILRNLIQPGIHHTSEEQFIDSLQVILASEDKLTNLQEKVHYLSALDSRQGGNNVNQSCRIRTDNKKQSGHVHNNNNRQRYTSMKGTTPIKKYSTKEEHDQSESTKSKVGEFQSAKPLTIRNQSKRSNIRYFILKCYNENILPDAVSKGTWSCNLAIEKKLHKAYSESDKVMIIFSAQRSKHFQGYAEMSSPIKKLSTPFTTPVPQYRTGIFDIKWIKIFNIPFHATKHLINPWNKGKLVHICRGGQELPPEIGLDLCSLWWTAGQPK